MNYMFKCLRCDNMQEISMPISQYNSKGHMCPKCGEEMVRDIADFCTASQRQVPGFFGVEKNK